MTDEKLTPYEEGKIFKMVELALRGGARIVQLRDKNTPREELLFYALQLKKLCSKFEALFIINDDVMLAKEVDADGVHIGKDDISLEEAVKKLPHKIIGVSCYGDLERALLAQALGASYVAFGSFYPSPTKPHAPTISLEILLYAKKGLTIPICAIGGITLEKAKLLVEYGADMLAVISDIWTSPLIEERARAYANLFKEIGSGGGASI
ncbi:MAG: thiamine phosphate synthase [Thermodesulfobacteriaceae bacterium]|nr:thiamine phosphate synthase [Thermodesulfobacteriaceae bacterium]